MKRPRELAPYLSGLRQPTRVGLTILFLVTFLLLLWFGERSVLDAKDALASPVVGVSPRFLIIDEPCDASEDSTGMSAAALPRITISEPLVAGSPLQVIGGVEEFTGASLRLDAAALSHYREYRHVTLKGFALTTQRVVDLELSQFSIFDQETEFVVGRVQGDVRVPAPEVVLLRGQVAGDPESEVFLGLSSLAVNGYVRTGHETYILSSGGSGGLAASNRQCTITRLGDYTLAADDPWTCGTPAESLTDVLPERSSSSTGVTVAGPRICYMALEGDFEYFQIMGSDAATAITYMTQLLAASSGITERDLGVSLWLNHVRVWTTPDDPYTECGLDGLREFEQYGNTYLQGEKWNLAYRFSGCGSGGAAFINSLCPETEPRGAHPYAASRIQGFFPYPLTPHPNNWDVYVLLHELGHNFGSRHTHCYRPPIDFCSGSEGSCFEGEEVCSQGTLMSYCNQCAGLIGIDLRYHERVIEHIVPRLLRSCLEIASSTGFHVWNGGSATLIIDSVISAAPWLTVAHSAFRVGPHDSVRVPVQIDWSALRELGESTEIRIYPNPISGLGPSTVGITANRRRPFAAIAASVTSGCWPLTVEFTDHSTNSPSSWRWRFSDGSESEVPNPVHTFTRAGRFPVSLIATNECGSHESSRSFLIEVNEPRLCCDLPAVIIPKNDSAIHVYDLRECADETPAIPWDSVDYSVSPSNPNAGVRIVENRYINIVPSPDWFGESEVIVTATVRNGCHCERLFKVIVNDEPKIDLLSPAAGVTITNDIVILSWTDSDRDNNARIQFYRSESPDCAASVPIPAIGALEDPDRDGDSLVWDVRGIPDGLYNVRVVISDLYTSDEDCSDGQILIDLTPPVSHAEFTCLDREYLGWCDGRVRVALFASDNSTGVSDILYRINDAATQVYSGPFDIQIEGSTKFEYYAVDIAGNVEPANHPAEPIRIDTKPPTIVAITSDNNRFLSGDPVSLMPTFTIQVIENGVGFDPESVEVTIAPGTASGQVTFTPDSTNYRYDPVAHQIHITLDRPLLAGTQVLSVSLSDQLSNRTPNAIEFTVASDLTLTHVINSPNPTQRETVFTFSISQDADITIRIYNLSGDLIRELTGTRALAGYNEMAWDGLSSNGQSLANGAYLYEIIATNAAGTTRHMDKLAILR